ncbi:MAG: hypothetical protein K5656_03745 [Lachnospiraceae bacterium]|nr:hypothetical protein [Lachnospiraceae bacterium]
MAKDNSYRRHSRRLQMLWHHCKLALMVILSAIILTVVSIVMAISGKLEFSLSYDHPILASLLLNEKPIDILDGDDYDAGDDDDLDTDSVDNDDSLAAASADASGDLVASEDASADAIVAGITRFEECEKVKTKSKYYSDPGLIAMTTDFEYTKVEDSYFEDALFIGDSRVVGLNTYSGLKDIATFYCEEGLSVFTMFEHKIAKVKGEKKAMTIDKALKKTSFSKIYIMVGINELGTGDTDLYAKQYEENINQLRKLQPNATIVIMSVMRVTADKAKDSVVNNVNINDKNVAAAKLADGINVFYFDINPLYVNKNGDIKDEYTWDGVHLKAEYYSKWVDFLKEHGIEK